MIKSYLLTLIAFCVVLSGFSQSKTNYHLSKLLIDNPDSDNLIQVYVRGNENAIKNCVHNANGYFKYTVGGISSVEIQVKNISKLLECEGIVSVKFYPSQFQPLNDSVLQHTSTLPVHAGQAPLPQGYDGSGVVMGYIDTGIDITHPDFKDNLGHTRIKYIWDHRATAGATPAAAPAGFAYGVEWDSTEIDNGQCTHFDYLPWSGHGTHVIGIGSGNGLATGQYMGVAPKSDIIVVALNFASPKIPDAVNYIYTKAKALGKPCVINASVGGDYGPHDGSDDESQTIKNLINQDSGQAFVAAAGNSGHIPFHLGYNVTADTNFTLFPKVGPGVYFEIFADTSDLNNVELAFGADQMAPVHSYRGRTKFTKISTMPFKVFVNDTVWNNGNRIGTLQYYLEPYGSRYGLYVFIIPDTAAYQWRLVTKGNGKFDLWNYLVPNMTASPITNSGLPSLATMPDSMFYKMPDTKKTVSSGFQCLDEVITVTNYINRNAYIDVTGTPQSIAVMPGARESTRSAKGPTADGRIKPDIAAPGHYSIAAIDKTYKATISPTHFTMALGGYHIRSGFTSQASPIVAGIAALYLQKNPTATATQVQQAIIKCPIQDSFTGNNLPDDYWGYGKVNAFGALNENLIVSQPASVSVCDGTNATFSTVANGTGLTYQWVIEQAGSLVNLTNAAPYSGVTTATLTVSSANVTLNANVYRCVVSNAYSCDVTSDEATLTILPLPTVLASSSKTTLCAGEALTLNGAGAAGYSWSGGVTNNVSFAASVNTTTYTVIGTDANNCSDTDVITITVNSLPIAVASASATTVCEGSSVTLNSSGTNAAIWSGGVTDAVAFLPSVGSTTYTVTETDVNNCSDTATITILVNSLPAVTANATSNIVCIGTAVTLSGNATLVNVWTGGVTNGLAFTPALGTVTYTVTGTDVNTCSDTASVTVTVVALPVVTLTGLAANYCFDADSVTLVGNPVGGTYSGTGITNTLTGVFNPLVAGTGSVTLTYAYTDGNNCSASASQSTTVLTPLVSKDSCPAILPPVIPGMDESIANIFTPNGDGINDEFKVNYNGPPASDFNLSVFDRWGNPVFRANNPNVKWDGRTPAGVKVSAGTYYYVVLNAGKYYKGYVLLHE